MLFFAAIEPQEGRLVESRAPPWLCAKADARKTLLKVAMQRLSNNLGGVDLSKFNLDAPLPDIPTNNARVSSVESYLAISRRDGLTLRQMAMRSAAAKHHWSIVGSVKQVADQLEEWFTGGAADGFNILPSDMPSAVNALVDRLVPELQRRRLFRTEYEGKTLRENLGLKRPADRTARGLPRRGFQ